MEVNSPPTHMFSRTESLAALQLSLRDQKMGQSMLRSVVEELY